MRLPRFKNKPEKKFKIKPDKDRFYFLVLVFESKEVMQGWYDEYRKKFDQPEYKYEKEGYDSNDWCGMCIPYTVIDIHEDKPETAGDELGIVILCKERLGTSVIVHEMGHCSFWYDRLIKGSNGCYGMGIGEDEERLLYHLAEFTRQCVDKLHKLGFYD